MEKKERVILYPTVEDLELSDVGLEAMALVEFPAVEYNFIKQNRQEVKKVFLTEEDKMIVTGPALVVNQEIYRNDPEMGDYYLVYTEDTIRKIVHKYFKQERINNMNEGHVAEDKVKGTMIESWFSKEDNELGFEGVPKGSWFVSYQIEDKDYWENTIKQGKVKGFSIEGHFILKDQTQVEQSIEETQLKKILDLLQNYTDLED